MRDVRCPALAGQRISPWISLGAFRKGEEVVVRVVVRLRGKVFPTRRRMNLHRDPNRLAARGCPKPVKALLDKPDDIVDRVIPRSTFGFAPTQPINASIGIGPITTYAHYLVISHCLSLSDYRNRLDPESQPDNLSGAAKLMPTGGC